MKKLVISALIVGISTATPLSVYAKTAKHGKHKHKPAPVQEEVVAIDRQIFDNSIGLAALTPQEMQETEGAFAPAWVAWTLTGAALNAWNNHRINYNETGQLASAGSAATAAGIGALSFGLGRGISKAAGLTGAEAAAMNANGAFVGATLNYAHNATQVANRRNSDFNRPNLNIPDEVYKHATVDEEYTHTSRAYNDMNYSPITRQDINSAPAPSEYTPPPMPENNYDF